MAQQIRPSVWPGLKARLKSLTEGVRKRPAIEAEMQEEFETHIEMRTDDLIAEGLSPTDALRKARTEFGLAETHKAAARASRGLDGIDEVRFSWLDVKTGIRMLGKHPGLTLVAVLALAIGIPVGLAPSHLASVFEAPLPEDRENRIRALRYWDRNKGLLESPSSWELDRWTEQLTSFESLGAVRSQLYNVGFSKPGSAAADSSRHESFLGAEITSTCFDMLGVRPQVGRTFQANDEQPGAANIAILSYRLWQTRFGGGSEVIDSTVYVAGVPHTVVGVMPESFSFPIRQHVWFPMRERVATEPFVGRELQMIGRLAAEVTAEQAQAELTGVGQQLAEEHPQTHATLEPEVVPFAMGFMNSTRDGLKAEPGFYVFQMLGLLLLFVACSNVAMLIFARAATRSRELAVRSALGASRARVISQMFAESLVLVLIASGLGLLVTDWALNRVFSFTIDTARLPYWLDLGVTPNVVLWTVGLGAASAVLAGIAPGWSVTRKQLGDNLASIGSGASGLRFGKLTGALIVADVAIGVVVVVVASGLSGRLVDTWGRTEAVGIPAAEYLTAEVRLQHLQLAAGDSSETDTDTRWADLHERLLEELAQDPDVRTATVATGLPRMDHPARYVEIEDLEKIIDPEDDRKNRVRLATVDVGYFEALDRPVTSGRNFDRADLSSAVPVALVDTLFVEQLLGGRNPVGRRLRFIPRRGSEVDKATSWHEIIGVVPALGLNVVKTGGEAGVYMAGAPGDIHPMHLAVHSYGDPQTLIPKLRDLLAKVEPTALLIDPRPLSQVVQRDWYFLASVAGGLFLLVGVLIALAASAIFAMTTFAVTQRTREIGIRNALGASKVTIAWAILRQTLIQLALGTAIGLPLSYLLLQGGFGGSTWGIVGLMSTGLLVILLIGVLACTSPTARALRIEPTQALRQE